MTDKPFIWKARIYYEDTDAGGVVYHANYLRFLERARSEWMRQIGHPVALIAKRDKCLFVVRSAQLKFKRPARLDDEISISAKIVDMRKASMRISQQITRGDASNTEILMQAVIELAMVSSDSFRPVAIPEFLTLFYDG